MTKASPNAGKAATPIARAMRRLLWSLPEPMKNGLSMAYQTLRRPAESPPPEITFPPDLEDREAVRTFLLDTDVFGSADDEGAGYLWHALERFRITLSITPDLPPGARVLELGANPYFFTRMLMRRGLDVTCANWFGLGADIETKGSDVVTSPSTGERLVIDYDHFDIELDRFPYEDGTFEVVFFCEILEHLPLDPVHALAEIHRVLRKPGGLLVLSTPNPVRIENLAKMLRGDNVYEPISGYGIHGRHNREYTVGELQVLLSELGFEPTRVFTADVSPEQSQPPPWFPGLGLSDRGEYVFATARAYGRDRWRYPAWLYQSRQALWRVVSPDLEVGVNDDTQSDGFLERETVDDREVRWLDHETEARVLLSSLHDGPGFLQIEGVAPPTEMGGPITLEIRIGDRELMQEVTHEIMAGSGWFSAELPIHVFPIDQVIYLRTSRFSDTKEQGRADRDRDPILAIALVALKPESPLEL